MRTLKQRAEYFGQTMKASPVVRELTIGQITDVIHAFVVSQTLDGKRRMILTRLARRAFNVNTAEDRQGVRLPWLTPYE